MSHFKQNKGQGRHIDIRLELGEDEKIKYIQKGRLRWVRHVMRMTREKIPKKILHTKI